MRKEIKEINIKDLIEEINSSSISSELVIKETETMKTMKSEIKYNFIFISGCDFALNKKSKKTNKTLVSFISQKLLFIYDENKKTKEIITEKKQIFSFFSDKKINDYIIEPNKLIYAKDGIQKRHIDTWLIAIQNNNPALLFLLKRGFLQLETFYSRYLNRLITVLEKSYNISPNLLIDIFEQFSYKQIEIAYLANNIYCLSDLDTVKYFLEKLRETSMKIDANCYYYNAFPDFKPYNLNGRTFIDYILFELYKQGKTNLSCLKTYADYLKQCIQFESKIRDKYPKNMETAHQIMSQKIIEKTRLSSKSPRFSEIMQNSEDFSYQNALDKFKIIMPMESNELVDEGQYLCHCVASYVEKVNDEDCIVVFMREKKQETCPYLTIEILPNRSINQIEGMNKRDELTDEEIVFINRWAKCKHLKIDTKNAIEKKYKNNKETA